MINFLKLFFQLKKNEIFGMLGLIGVVSLIGWGVTILLPETINPKVNFFGNIIANGFATVILLGITFSVSYFLICKPIKWIINNIKRTKAILRKERSKIYKSYIENGDLYIHCTECEKGYYGKDGRICDGYYEQGSCRAGILKSYINKNKIKEK